MVTDCRTRPWTVAGNGVSVMVRLTPRGGRDAIDGVDVLADGTPVLKARVRAAPSDGEANAALVALLAKSLRVPRRDVRFTAGESARRKRLDVSGNPANLIAMLEDLVSREGRTE